MSNENKTETKTPRTIEAIQADLDRNERSWESAREYFGAMWSCDIQASLTRQSLNGNLEALRKEMREARTAASEARAQELKAARVDPSQSHRYTW
jgi:hypothetical protein